TMHRRVQPVGVNLAVVGRIEDLLEAVPVEVDHHRVGDRGRDHRVVHGAGGAPRAGGRDHRPVEAATAPARAVQLEDERHLVEGGVGGAVVDVAHHDHLGNAVAVDVGHHGGAVLEVGAVLG